MILYITLEFLSSDYSEASPTNEAISPLYSFIDC